MSTDGLASPASKRALLLDGMPEGNDSGAALNEIVERRLRAAGWSLDPWCLHEARIAPCRGCYDCWTATPGECGTDDDGRLVARSLAGSDLVVMLTPVTFGGYSSDLKKAIDRLIPDVLPFMVKVVGETHHEPRYPRRLGLLVIGTATDPDAESERVFLTLVARNAINFRADRHAAAVLAEGAPSSALEARVDSLLQDMGVALPGSGRPAAGQGISA